MTTAPLDSIAIELDGVPETMLWPLWNRAAEMRRRNRLIEDPMAVELVEKIDYDFARNFGKPTVFHPIRARLSDDLIKAYIARTATEPVVVALGDGLDTQLWRIDHPSVSWLSVDVAEAVEVRQRLLPADARAQLISCSALDADWLDAVPAGTTPFISAAGLLMYFETAQVHSLLTKIAERFPGAEIFFDTITSYMATQTLNGLKVTKYYKAPPMPWGISLDELPDFIGSIKGLKLLSLQSYADPFPYRTLVYKCLSYIPPIKRRFAGGLVHLRVL